MHRSRDTAHEDTNLRQGFQKCGLFLPPGYRSHDTVHAKRLFQITEM